MSFIINKPVEITYSDILIQDPITKKWGFPSLTFDFTTFTPYTKFDIDPLNEDKYYIKSVIRNIRERLREKWLHNDEIFIKLLKYFKVVKKGDGNSGEISLVDNPDKLSNTHENLQYKKFIFKYIEKVFLTDKFVKRTLKKYVSISKIKWYDLYNNSRNLKHMFAHTLKKVIIENIYKDFSVKSNK